MSFSRRELLRRAGFLGVAASVPVRVFASAQAAARAPQPWETLTAAEAETLEAIVARLIPTDGNGPGATEANAAHYIDRALGGALASSRDAYRNGLAAVDAYARTSKGAPFARLSNEQQDAVLTDVENDVATGFMPSASTFFNLVRAHTIQGTFCDPFYGGNMNFVGWDLIGYPGIRLAVGASDQRLDPQLMPIHRSAYEFAMFSRKKPARASVPHAALPHGD